MSRVAGVEAQVSLHVARVWLTHSSALLRELRSCLTEFKQYLANLARSIRAAAADMALGLVHPRYAASRIPDPVCVHSPPHIAGASDISHHNAQHLTSQVHPTPVTSTPEIHVPAPRLDK